MITHTSVKANKKKEVTFMHFHWVLNDSSVNAGKKACKQAREGPPKH
jgi:hypothetical protein